MVGARWSVLYPPVVAARPAVRELAPALVEEIKLALEDLGETDLLGNLDSLEAWGRCSCGDEFCSSFYTGPRPNGAWSNEGDHRNVALPVSRGMVILDIVSGEIRYVEVLDRPDIEALIRDLPPLPRTD